MASSLQHCQESVKTHLDNHGIKEFDWAGKQSRFKAYKMLMERHERRDKPIEYTNKIEPIERLIKV